ANCRLWTPGLSGLQPDDDVASFDPLARLHQDLPNHAVAGGARRDPDRAGQRRADVHQRLSVVYLIADFHQTVLQHHARQGALHLEQIRGRGEPRPNSTRRKCLTVPRQPVELERAKTAAAAAVNMTSRTASVRISPPTPQTPRGGPHSS